MSPLTVFLGRFFGLFCLLMCAALIARPKAAIEAINSLMNSPGLLLVTGICTLAGGVATVIGHNVWQGGALPVVVTVLGWLTLIKGIALMVTPPETLGRSYRWLHDPRWFRIYMTVALAFSLWLTVAAFMA
jgi:ribose/xylose/arabinose/galactoside ABC-type transport system permease subunit